jgi:hypothetical protein
MNRIPDGYKELGSDQPNVLIFLEFFFKQTVIRALIRHFDRPFGRLTSTRLGAPS